MSQTTEIYNLYLRGRDFLNRTSEFSKAAECRRFYEGDQWYGLESGGERLPVYNTVAPVVNYKVALVANKRFRLAADSLSRGAKNSATAALLRALTLVWEQTGMDALQWEIAKEACVTGTAAVYFYQGEKHIEAELLDSLCVMLENECEPDVQRQGYILLSRKLPLSRVLETAKRNGATPQTLSLIAADAETDARFSAQGGVCLCITKLWRENGEVHFAEVTKSAQIRPDTAVAGLSLYPVSLFRWNRKSGAARGIGEVYPLIPNQIEINKCLARTAVALKNSAYPRLAYLSGSVANPDDLSKVGTPIEVMAGAVSDLDNVLRYVEPAQVSTLAVTFAQDMLNQTRTLAGVGEAVTGAVNPENASGAAIIAAREAAEVFMNAPQAEMERFAENAARVWADMLCAYSPSAFGGVSAEEIRAFAHAVRIEVSRCDAFSKYAADSALEKLQISGAITFEEYVSALDDDSLSPKAKLQKLLSERGGKNARTE